MTSRGRSCISGMNSRHVVFQPWQPHCRRQRNYSGRLMVYRVIVLCVALLIASPVAAGTIVTWQGSGVVDFSYRMFPNQVVPPVGTPLAFTLSFDPTLATPT